MMAAHTLTFMWPYLRSRRFQALVADKRAEGKVPYHAMLRPDGYVEIECISPLWLKERVATWTNLYREPA